MIRDGIKFIPASGNSKTGPMPATIIDEDTCPPECSFKNSGCFGENFPLSLHWRNMNDTLPFDPYAMISAIPPGYAWRHAIAGDLPGKGDHINEAALKRLVKANGKSKGFGYTHKPWTPRNVRLIKWACNQGFRLYVSCEHLEEGHRSVREAIDDHGFRYVAVSLPSNARPNDPRHVLTKTRGILTVHTCAQQSGYARDCLTCGWCFREPEDDRVIGFIAHGNQKHLIDAAIANGSLL